MFTTIQDAVNQLLPAKRKTSSSGWTSFNAPCCHHRGESLDSRSRGGLIANPNGSVSYHCFNCNFKASYVPGRHLSYKFRKLLSWFGADENTVKRLVIEAIRVQETVAPETLTEPQEEIVFKPRPLPEDAKTLVQWTTWYTLKAEEPELVNLPSDFAESVTYANNRLDLSKYEIYWTPETAYNLNRRVIVPFTWHNEIIGYTARTWHDEVKPKYYSQYEPNYVFNVDRQLPNSRFVIVCEGPFDAMAVDGVAVLSNECSETQADIIDSLSREVVVVPDSDSAGAKLINNAIEYGWTVSFPVWLETCKDISEAVSKHGKLFTLKAIIEGRESSRLKIELMKRKLYN
jgi:hypothetical protein